MFTYLNIIKKKYLNFINGATFKIFFILTSFSFCVNNNRTISVLLFDTARSNAVQLNDNVKCHKCLHI